MRFPKHFLLGAAMAAHQVEGNNIYSNWWHEEQAGRVAPSGEAADHYHKFDSDFVMAQQLGLNAMRISIEWSRIEPEEGKWSEEGIAHYHRVFKSMKRHGLLPMVTLFHWTMPQWLAEKGGFETEFGVRAFRKFVRAMAIEYKGQCRLWLTINEPEVLAFKGYYFGKHAPFKTDLFLALRVYRNLIKAHREAYRTLKRYIPNVKVGIAKNVAYHEPFRQNHMLDKSIVRIARKFNNELFIDRIKNELDFIGLNYYFTYTVKFDWRFGFAAMNDAFPKSEMGIKTYPLGLYHVLKQFAKYDKPLYVTENGIANANDAMRAQFIKAHLAAVSRARSERVPIKGYFYWSLIDTYEWHDGNDLKFGLAEVDYSTQVRKSRIGHHLFPSHRKK